MSPTILLHSRQSVHWRLCVSPKYKPSILKERFLFVPIALRHSLRSNNCIPSILLLLKYAIVCALYISQLKPMLGVNEGAMLGANDGATLGAGTCVGVSVGIMDGFEEGVCVGISVGD